MSVPALLYRPFNTWTRWIICIDFYEVWGSSLRLTFGIFKQESNVDLTPKFIDNIPPSDFLGAYMSSVRPLAFPDRAGCGWQPDTPGISSPRRRLYEPEAGFRTKSLRTCSGSLTPRVRCATRFSATYRIAFPTKSQGRQPEIGDFGAQ